MEYNVAQILKEGMGYIREYDVEEYIDDIRHISEGCGQKLRVAGRARLLRTDRGIWLSATLEAQVPDICSRCLIYINNTIDIGIEEEFKPVIDIETASPIDNDDVPNEGFLIDQNNILSIEDAIRQYLDLNSPMKPICDTSCKGICLTCGINLNENACCCDAEMRDPRWGDLEKLAVEWEDCGRQADLL